MTEEQTQHPEEQPQLEETKKEEHIPEAPRKEMIPKSRFDEVNERYKSLKNQLEESMEQVRNYQEQTQNAQARLDRLDKVESGLQELLARRKGQLPEHVHELIPDHLSSEAQINWIEKALEKGIFSPKPVGMPSNPDAEHVDYSTLSSHQLLSMGYQQKK